jgi:hypothetical protein
MQARKKTTQRPCSRAKTEDRPLRKIAGLEFDPIADPGPEYANANDLADAVREIIGTRAWFAAALLSADKSKMVTLAKQLNEHSGAGRWCELLDGLRDASELMEELCQILKTAYLRGLVVTGVLALEEEGASPAATAA